MDQSSCKEPFPEAELERVLPPKLLDLYYRVRQRKEIAAAGLEGLEECPFCDFKYVIENADEKLFRCQNDECQAITCRECKKPVCLLICVDKSFNTRHRIIYLSLARVSEGERSDLILFNFQKEMEDDTRLTGRHAVEEALCEAENNPLLLSPTIH